VPPELRLHDQSAWTASDRCAVRGTAFDADSTRLVTADGMREEFEACRSVESVAGLLQRLDGHYAVVLEMDGRTVLATDHARSVPLFYLSDGSAVGDSARTVLSGVDRRAFDPVAEAEFLLASYVTGSDTLDPALDQVEAGQLVVIDHAMGGVTTEQYTRYTPGGDASAATRADLRAAIERAVERLCRVADGRPIVVLLSGGVDSRVVLSQLLERGYDPLRALTFGRSDAAEVATARRVAAATGVDWEFVEYDAATWRAWFHSEERERYYDLVFNLDSVPGFQAGPALSVLRERGELPDEAVFVTGQTIASVGEHLPPDDVRTRRDLIEYVLETHYALWDRGDDLRATLRERVDEQLPATHGPGDVVPAYEHWEWKERQSKFITQDGFMYSFHGYDWWFPLFDPLVVDAWGRLPVEQRRDKAALREYAEESFRSVAGDVDGLETGTAGDGRSNLDRVKQLVAGSPAGRSARQLYRWYRAATGRPHPLAAYDPLGYYGILGEDQPGEYYTGSETMWSYFVMHATGRMSFDPPDASGVPEDCVVSIAALES
jgi:asparagine synthase (glutamine-hydrolysing)